ncbi:uncharacterized protein [Periplaneta americana]|uniref:uncharacterized protein isoform X2 n=1 Tax=Periplaneta americana TaxID=6978 RepID=UPI0037E8127C
METRSMKQKSHGKCCAPECRNVSIVGGKHFFNFPQEPMRCWKWLRFCGLEDRYRVASDVTHSLKICIDHFAESAYYRLPHMVRLHKTAVPTLHANGIMVSSSPKIQSLPHTVPMPRVPVTLSVGSTSAIRHHKTLRTYARRAKIDSANAEGRHSAIDLKGSNEVVAGLTTMPPTILSSTVTPTSITVSRTYPEKAKIDSATTEGRSSVIDLQSSDEQVAELTVMPQTILSPTSKTIASRTYAGRSKIDSGTAEDRPSVIDLQGSNEQVAELTAMPQTIPSSTELPTSKVIVSRTYAGRTKRAYKQGNNMIDEQLKEKQHLSHPFIMVPTTEVARDLIKTELDTDPLALQNDGNLEELKPLVSEGDFLKVDVDQIKTESPDPICDLISSIKHEEVEDPISFPPSNLDVEAQSWFEHSTEEKPVPTFSEEDNDSNDRIMERFSEDDVRSNEIDVNGESVQQSGVVAFQECT